LIPNPTKKFEKPKDRVALVTVPTMSYGKHQPLKLIQVNATYNATLNMTSFELKEENYQVAMEPQRIRTFRITYILPEEV
jgi:hypothetical protein